MQTFVIVAFVAVYAGMALGRWPGLRLDRTGIALLGALAVFSTLAGNLILVGSFANLIVVERAAAAGVDLGFADHA